MAKQHSDKTIEKLIDYLTATEGTVYLNDQEEQLLKMVSMAHGLFHTHKYTNLQISRMISAQFNCSPQTAYMAMHDSQIIFGATSVYNRRYMAALFMDEIIADVQRARETGNEDLLVKLQAIKVKLVEQLPADAPIRDITPATIIFNILKADVEAPKLSMQQVMANAMRHLNLPTTEIVIEDAG